MSTDTHTELIEVVQDAGVTIVRFARRTILDPEVIETLGDRLQALVRDNGSRQVVLNFERVESVTSAMLGKFAALHNSLTAQGGQVVCCQVGDFLGRIFTLCNFPQAIPIYPDETAAIQALVAAQSL